MIRLIPQGDLPPTRTMRDLFGGLVVECDRPPLDEPLCDIAAREGAHVGGVSTTDWAKGKSEWDWFRRRKRKNTTSKGDADGPQEERPGEGSH